MANILESRRDARYNEQLRSLTLLSFMASNRIPNLKKYLSKQLKSCCKSSLMHLLSLVNSLHRNSSRYFDIFFGFIFQIRAILDFDKKITFTSLI